MSIDLRELYQELILDHSKRPRNSRALEGACCTASGHNPLCGDQITVYVREEGDRLAEVTYVASGCAISVASASMMSEALRGKTRAEAEALVEAFQKMVTSTGETVETPEGLEVFAGVREHPVRIKCAVLPWHALRAAMGSDGGVGSHVSTE